MLSMKANHYIRDRTLTANTDRKQLAYTLSLKITHDAHDALSLMTPPQWIQA